MRGKLTFRPAAEGDVDLLFRWVNNPEVRAGAFQTGPVEYETHRTWFSKKIKSKDALLLIFLDAEAPVGQVRFEIEAGTAEVDVSVDSAYRKQGLASQMLAQATEHLFKTTQATAAHAHIKSENTGSIRAFENAGYTEKTPTTYKNNPCVRLTRVRRDTSR